jgi:hypothetical protein
MSVFCETVSWGRKKRGIGARIGPGFAYPLRKTCLGGTPPGKNRGIPHSRSGRLFMAKPAYGRPNREIRLIVFPCHSWPDFPEKNPVAGPIAIKNFQSPPQIAFEIFQTIRLIAIETEKCPVETKGRSGVMIPGPTIGSRNFFSYRNRFRDQNFSNDPADRD